jgi:hypothetical protein
MFSLATLNNQRVIEIMLDDDAEIPMKWLIWLLKSFPHHGLTHIYIFESYLCKDPYVWCLMKPHQMPGELINMNMSYPAGIYQVIPVDLRELELRFLINILYMSNMSKVTMWPPQL